MFSKEVVHNFYSEGLSLVNCARTESILAERGACAKVLRFGARRQAPEGQHSWVADVDGVRCGKRGKFGHILGQKPCRHAQNFSFHPRSSGKTLEALRHGSSRILFSV